MCKILKRYEEYMFFDLQSELSAIQEKHKCE